MGNVFEFFLFMTFQEHDNRLVDILQPTVKYYMSNIKYGSVQSVFVEGIICLAGTNTVAFKNWSKRCYL